MGNFGALTGAGCLISGGRAMRGKYAMMSTDEILDKDPGYLVWLVENTENHGVSLKLLQTARLAVEQRHDEKQARKNSKRTRMDDIWGNGDGDADADADMASERDDFGDRQ